MDPNELRSIVDASGFAFQLAVEELANQSNTDFKVLAVEHAWVHPTTGNNGFADIILESGRVRLVIECKRVRGGGQWVFLRPDDRSPLSGATSNRVETLWTGVSANDEARATDGFFALPHSSQCPYCVVRGSGEGQVPMLERVAGGVLEATEAIADEQMQMDRSNRHKWDSQIRVYVPLVVTNADLYVCSFSPRALNPTDGLLPPDAQFEPAGIVRFFKNLAFTSNPLRHQNLRESHAAKNRTVFVVNTLELPKFLKQFTLSGDLPAAVKAFR